MFEWVPFLQSRGIEYVERGANVAKNYVNIRCPWCGNADPSHHLGVPLDSSGGKPWGCWRSAEHRGRSPVRLIQILAGCSWEEAKAIAGRGADHADPFDELLRKLETEAPAVSRSSALKPLKFPEDFDIPGRFDPSDRFIRYLSKRGFHDPGALVERYGLRRAMTGEYAWRLIIPFFDPREGLVGWTGRAIAQAEIRYKTHPPGDSIRRVLFNSDKALKRRRKRLLVVCEGPLDVLKVDFYAEALGVAAVGLLGQTLTAERGEALGALALRYERVGILLDSDATAQALALSEELAWLPGGAPRVLALPEGTKDPGELSSAAVESFFRYVLSSWTA